MDKNYELYMASLCLYHASNFLFKHDKEFAKGLLDKSNEYMNQVEVDDKLDEEVKKYAESLMQSKTKN